eukprot:16334129-Heterocapsa_arctica.AAC.1
MDEERCCTSRLYSELGMPDVDNQQKGHRVGRVRCGNWYMAHLQKPKLLQTQCDRGNRDGDLIATRQ